MPGTGYIPEYDFNPERPAGATDTVSLIDNWVNSNNQHQDNAYAVEHYAPSNDSDASEDDFGRHDYISLKQQSSKPSLTGSTNRTAFYTKSGGVYVEKADGTEIQILNFTTGRSGVDADIPSGEYILFYKDTAVTGYSLVTSINDYVVYVGSGTAAGGLPGFAARSGSTWTQPNHTHTFSATTGTPSGDAQDQGDGTSVCAVSTHTHTVSGTSGNGATANTWRPLGAVFTLQLRA